MNFSILVLAAMTCALMPTSSFAQSTTQTYRIDWYQATDAECPAHAAVIAEKFQTVTGLPVLASGCERPFTWKQDVIIQYVAPAPANLISTWAEFAMDQGTFATKADCEAGLPSEKALFTGLTELPVVAAFCYPESSLRSENGHPYVARIDSFGTPVLRPFVFDRQIYTIPAWSRADLEAAIAVAAEGMIAVRSPRVKVDFSENSKRVVIKYYATRKRPLTLDTFGSFEDARACDAHTPDSLDMLEAFGTTGAVVFCTREQFSNVAPLYYFGLATGAYSIERAAGSYPTRAACETRLPQVIAQYEAARSATNVDGFCSYERTDVFAPYAFFARVIFSI